MALLWGIGHPGRFDLAVIVRDVLDAHQPEAAERGLPVEVSLEPARISGDQRLAPGRFRATGASLNLAAGL